jgi:hypothetical protein
MPARLRSFARLALTLTIATGTPRAQTATAVRPTAPPRRR